jgi:hypothetical protein
MLPPGVHLGTLEEVRIAFAWNRRRRTLFEGLEQVVSNLTSAGCRSVWLDGSFVTAKELPGDFDAVWDLDDVDFDLVDPVILDVEPPRLAQRLKFGADLLPNVLEGGTGMPFIEFFQEDKATGARRGIVRIELGGPT